jgi:hypothetical protein
MGEHVTGDERTSFVNGVAPQRRHTPGRRRASRSLAVALVLSLLPLAPATPGLAAGPEAAEPGALGTTAPFERFEWLELAEDEDELRSAVIDPAGRYAYFATGGAPSLVLKVDLRTFTRVGAIELPDGPLRAAVIDPAGRYAYFGGRARVVKIDLQSFTRVDALPVADVSSAVMDPAGRYAYFGTNTTPGQVVKLDLRTFTRVGALTLRTGENRLATAVIDPAGRYAYFGTVGVHGKEPARIVKVDLTSLSRAAAITLRVYYDPEDEYLDALETSLGAAVIDPAGRYAYFGTNTNYEGFDDQPNWEHLVKIDLATFARADTLQVEGAGLESGVIDPAGRHAYFGTDDLEMYSGTLVRVGLARFGRVVSRPHRYFDSDLVSAVIDPAGRYAYFGTRPGYDWYDDPDKPQGGGRVVRVALAPEALPTLEGQLATSYTTTRGWAAHLAADVDGDGRADLLSYHPKRGRWWLSTGRADGTFNAPRLATSYTTTDGWQTHLAADVDGDGRADLLSYHPKRGRWWLSRGRLDGTLDPPKLATTYTTTDGWQTHLAADFDGDGRADLRSYHPKSGRWSLSSGRADGTFDPPRPFSRAETPGTLFLTADVDGDGKAAVLRYETAGGRWWIGGKTILYGTRTGWDAHLAADVTGNGRADVLSYHPKRGRWSITTSRDDAWFDEPRTLTRYGTTTGWQTHLAADVTGDGRAELLSYHPGRGRWWVSTPTGNR